MADVRPFKGLRPRKDLETKLPALPYDVMNSEEAREMAKGNPQSFLHISKAEIDLDPSIDLYDEKVYAKARENFDMFQKEGWLVREAKPCFYIYRQIMGKHAQTGVLVGASVTEYVEDKIKKHELTRKDKEDDRTKHVEVLNANSGPVFLTYRAIPEIKKIVAEITARKSDYDVTFSDNVRHVLWIVSDEKEIAGIQKLFKEKVPVTYVADGHHRSASAARAGKNRREKNSKHTGNEEYNFFLAVMFPHDELAIMDYNRVVKDLNGNDKPAFLKKVEEKFEVVKLDKKVGAGFKPEKTHCFGMFLDGNWYRLTAKKNTFDEKDPVASLDVSVLQKNLLDPILAIKDPRTDKRINFVGGIRGMGELEKLVSSGKYAVAFSMHPTTIEELISVADSGKIMPPKSTWFEPKLRSGFVVHTLD